MKSLFLLSPSGRKKILLSDNSKKLRSIACNIEPIFTIVFERVNLIECCNKL